MTAAALFYVLIVQDGIRFQADWEGALQEAKKSGKCLMIAFFQPGCEYCKELEADSFSRPEVIELHNKNFINVKIARRNPELARRYQVPRTPSLVLVDSNGEPLWSLYGYVPPDDYQTWLRTAVTLGRYPAAVLGKSEEAADYRQVGDAFARISHDGRAIEMYDKALALNEKKKPSEATRQFKAETIARKGFSHYKNNDSLDMVEAAAKTLLEIDPDGSREVRDNGLFLKALADATAGRGAEAAAAVDEALAKHPKSDVRDGLLYIKAYWAMSQGDKAGARRLYQEILEKYPESHFRLGAEDALKSLQ